MTTDCQVRPYDPAHCEQLAQFVSACTGGAMDPEWVSEVLTFLVSDAGAICELWRDGAVVGVGVSLDGRETEGNAGELSVFTQPAGEHALVAAVLDWGEARVGSAGCSRVDIPCWPNTGLPVALLSARGYRVGHVNYNMARADAAGPLPQPRTPLPADWRWGLVDDTNIHDYYATLRAAWRGLPSAFVDPFEQFRERVLSFDRPPTLLFSTDAATPVAGFVRVKRRSDGSGEVAAVGRHPVYRGYGLGEHLMVRAMSLLQQLDARPIGLEVTAGNDTGLALYRAFGFEVDTELPVYSRPLG